MSSLTVKFVSRKISKIKWKPQSSSVFVTGSWDDEDNRLSVWNLPETSPALKDSSSVSESSDPQLASEICFHGSVTDLKVTARDLIFASSSYGSIHIYKYADKKLQETHCWEKVHTFLKTSAPATGIAVKGNEVVSTGEDGRICVFDFNRLLKIRQIESSDLCALTTVSYLRHQEIVVGNVLGYLKTWDLRSGSDKPAHTLMISGDQVGVMALNSHPSQPHVLATGHEDGTLCIWDLRQENRPATLLAGHSAAVMDVLFHPVNPDYLFTCSIDGAVWQWNGTALRTAPASGDLEQNVASGNPWLNCDASKHRLDIVSLFPYNSICVNCLDLNSSVLLCGTDNEAIYVLPDISV